jgi:2-polyprenyl-6-methoxyphenol hydroxylase-like FAD-dependent oxidoreductase
MGALGRQAVVIGGSVAGLVAARVLAARYAAVTVLDRDSLPDGPQARRGVPQGPHAHALLIRGRMGLEELFPGLADELVAAGAVPFDPGQDLLFHQMGALRIRFPSGKVGISCSRAFLEQRIRARVAGLDNVLIRARTPVTDLLWEGDRVAGVVVDDQDRIAADVVVDATGRSGGRTDRWLASHGCPTPRSAQVKVGVGYTTRLYHRPPEDRMQDGGLLYLMAARPPHDKRAAATFAIEGGRWIVTLGGWHGAHAPVDHPGFDKFASELPDGHVAELISRSEPVDDDPAEKFTYPAARRRYFEELRNPPAGFAAIGDAICSFNPIYGQGMTIATLEALALGRCLDAAGGATPAMARAYYRAAAKEIKTPWQMATGGDFMYPETSGPKAFGTDLVNRYVKQVMLASHVSVPAHRLLVDMQHLLVPPTAIMRPDRIVRWLAAARRSPAR